MSKYILCLILIVVTKVGFSQSGFEDWDENYKFINVDEVIAFEEKYAQEVEKDTTTGHYYVRIDTYRFFAEYTGNIRLVKDDVINSVKRVLKIKTGDSGILNDLVSKEYEFNVGNSKVWMPIQNQLLDFFNNEVNKGDKVLLYALFTNEHHFEGGITNIFLISEFTTEWTD